MVYVYDLNDICIYIYVYERALIYIYVCVNTYTQMTWF